MIHYLVCRLAEGNLGAYFGVGSYFLWYLTQTIIWSCTIMLLFSLQEILEHKYMLLILLSLDIVYNIVRETIASTVSDVHAASIITVISFCLIGCSLISLAIIGLRFTTVTSASFAAWLLQLLAVVLYFYGDNIDYILQRYGDELHCGETCQERNWIAAKLFLGTALTTLYIIPLLYKDTVKLPGSTYKCGWWHYALSMVTILVKVDMIYSALVPMPPSSSNCDSMVVTLSSSFFVILSIIGCAGIVINCRYTKYAINTNDKKKDRKCDISLFIVGILLFLCLPLYLLSDNQQPIDCIFGCDSFAFNTTMTNGCDMKTNSVLRLSLMGWTAVSALLTLGVFLCKWRTHDDSANYVI